MDNYTYQNPARTCTVIILMQHGNQHRHTAKACEDLLMGWYVLSSSFFNNPHHTFSCTDLIVHSPSIL